MLRCEVAVVGGGPAGATAARFLAEAGRDVALFEAAPSPRDKPCGGGLRPAVLSGFPHLDRLRDRFLEGVSTRGLMGTEGVEDVGYTSPPGEPPVMFQTRRSVFDRVLLDDAIDRGAQVHEGARVAGASGTSREWRLRTSDGLDIVAKGVIGAGGARCPLGRRLRADTTDSIAFPRKNLAIAWSREYLVGEAFVEEAYGPERAVRIDLKEGGLAGYAWAFPKRQHVNVGFGALVDELTGVDGPARCQDYAEKLVFMGFLPENPIGGSWRAAPIPMGGPLGPLSRPGVLSLGDCVGLVSPLAGDGIYYAMESGRLAADVMHEALAAGDLTAEAMATYGTLVKRSIGKELALLSKVSERLVEDPVQVMRRAAADPSIPPLVVKLFQGEGNLRATAVKLYGRSLLAGLRR